MNTACHFYRRRPVRPRDARLGHWLSDACITPVVFAPRYRLSTQAPLSRYENIYTVSVLIYRCVFFNLMETSSLNYQRSLFKISHAIKTFVHSSIACILEPSLEKSPDLWLPCKVWRNLAGQCGGFACQLRLDYRLPAQSLYYFVHKRYRLAVSSPRSSVV